MNTALLMLGSNANAELNIELAKDKISEYYEIVAVSSRITTQAFGKQYKSGFCNEAIKILSDETAEETKATFKLIETELGRTDLSKKDGIIPIDIDLISWNGSVMHKDYDRFDFVRKCIDEIKTY